MSNDHQFYLIKSVFVLPCWSSSDQQHRMTDCFNSCTLSLQWRTLCVNTVY